MSTMIERVARAIYRARCVWASDADVDASWIFMVPEAIAALKAMRTPDMNEVLKASRRYSVRPSTIDLIWCELHDAALSEKEP